MGVLGRAGVSRPWDAEEERTCLRWAHSSQAESASRPVGPGETGSGSESPPRGMPTASAPRSALLRGLRNRVVGW